MPQPPPSGQYRHHASLATTLSATTHRVSHRARTANQPEPLNLLLYDDGMSQVRADLVTMPADASQIVDAAGPAGSMALAAAGASPSVEEIICTSAGRCGCAFPVRR